MAHVLARLSGLGLVVTPHPRYRIDRVDGAAETMLRVARGSTSGIVDVAAIARGESESELPDVTPGPNAAGWRIETSVLTCAWPQGFALAHDPDGISPFLLLGPRDAML